MSTSAKIDLNVRVRGNATYVGFEDLDDVHVQAGDSVRVWESESGLHGFGQVIEVDVENELVYLKVDWAGLREVQLPSGAVMPTVPDTRAGAHTIVPSHSGTRPLLVQVPVAV